RRHTRFSRDWSSDVCSSDLPYVASKHGVLGLTRAAAVEFADAGIRVNAVSPGITRTGMTTPAMEAVPDEFNEHIRRNVPLGRVRSEERRVGTGKRRGDRTVA